MVVGKERGKGGTTLVYKTFLTTGVIPVLIVVLANPDCSSRALYWVQYRKGMPSCIVFKRFRKNLFRISLFRPDKTQGGLFRLLYLCTLNRKIVLWLPTGN